MKRIHLLRVEQDAASFAALIDAVGEDEGRVGWLELGEAEPPDGLDDVAALGTAQVVRAGAGSTVAVKRRAGAPVLRDLLREYFLGCRAVLVVGEVDAPLLVAAADGWKVTTPDGTRSYSTEKLVRALRRPDPFS